MIVICSWCRRVRIKGSGVVSEGVKRGVDLYWAKPDDPDPTHPDDISHGMCPECEAKR